MEWKEVQYEHNTKHVSLCFAEVNRCFSCCLKKLYQDNRGFCGVADGARWNCEDCVDVLMTILFSSLCLMTWYAYKVDALVTEVFGTLQEAAAMKSMLCDVAGGDR